jgi:hypothetical protein
MNEITKKLLRTEEGARKFFEKVPFIHAFLAGVGVIIFWRGVWELFDQIGITPVQSIIMGVVLLGGIGVFIQTFLGNTIIIKDVAKKEKSETKLIKEVESEVSGEEITLKQLAEKIDRLTKKLEEK